MVAQQLAVRASSEQSGTNGHDFVTAWSVAAAVGVDEWLSGLNLNPFAAPPNLANRLAWKPAMDGSCGKCGAERVSFRPIRWQGIVTMVCAVCGNDHTTRAGPGMPDECVALDVDDGTACGFLLPCPAHQEGRATSVYGPLAISETR